MGREHLGPVAVPEVCWKKLEFFCNTKSTIFMISFVGTFLCTNLSYCLRRTSRPSVWGILGYSPTTSAVTRIAHSIVSPESLSLPRK